MKITIHKERFLLYVKIGLAYWILQLFIMLASSTDNFLKESINHIWLISYLAFFNYLFFDYTLPFFKFTWKRLVAVPFLLFAYMLCYSFGLYAWRFIGIALHIYTPLIVYDSTNRGLEEQMAYSMGTVVFFGLIIYTYDHRKLKQTAQQLRIEKQEAELNYLKSQTNPHFLFNTLNNIYSLARDKSDLAPESILRLSKILRFMLYETNGAYIAIEQELKIIGDYIELEKLRYDESLHINFNYDVEDMKQALPPLLLIPLVENAFKHGTSETRGHPFVDIHLSVKDRRLRFFVKNSTEPFIEERSVKENIGLSNLRRQLELLYTDYKLSVQQREAVFTATLTINLASHV